MNIIPSSHHDRCLLQLRFDAMLCWSFCCLHGSISSAAGHVGLRIVKQHSCWPCLASMILSLCWLVHVRVWLCLRPSPVVGQVDLWMISPIRMWKRVTRSLPIHWVLSWLRRRSTWPCPEAGQWRHCILVCSTLPLYIHTEYPATCWYTNAVWTPTYFVFESIRRIAFPAWVSCENRTNTATTLFSANTHIWKNTSLFYATVVQCCNAYELFVMDWSTIILSPYSCLAMLYPKLNIY